MEISRELYNGWLVLAVLEDSCWTFECHKPGGKTHVDTEAYQNAEQAMSAAREFVRRDTAEVALLQVFSN